jgi:hypothetical protein
MNYQVSPVAASTDGYGFNIIDSRRTPLVRIEFEREDNANEARRVIGRAIEIATKITPYR